MKAGEKIKNGDVAVLRTEKVLTPGISPKFLEEITGKTLKHEVKAGSGVNFEDFAE